MEVCQTFFPQLRYARMKISSRNGSKRVLIYLMPSYGCSYLSRPRTRKRRGKKSGGLGVNPSHFCSITPRKWITKFHYKFFFPFNSVIHKEKPGLLKVMLREMIYSTQNHDVSPLWKEDICCLLNCGLPFRLGLPCRHWIHSALADETHVPLSLIYPRWFFSFSPEQVVPAGATGMIGSRCKKNQQRACM